MSDWRDSDAPKRKPQKVQPKDDLPQLSPKPTGGWKGKNASPPAGKSLQRSNTQRSHSKWKGEVADAEVLNVSALWKWLVVGTLSTVAFLLTAYVVVYVFFKPPKLPVFVFAVSNYKSPEFISNPFADSQRARFSEANKANVAAHKLLNAKNDDDNALASLKDAGWLKNFKEFGSHQVKGGGPDGRVVAFYINSYATFTRDDDLLINSQLDQPFSSNSNREPTTIRGLKLEDVLRNAISSVPSKAIAWVILDLQLPPNVPGLNDLDPPWQTAAQRALDRLDKDQLQHVLVTLPAEDGQQNWLAPEFSGSFFGYYTLQLLEGRFARTNLLSRDVTIKAFRDLLGDKVSNRVINRRFARQNPVWLPEETAKKVASVKLVTVPTQQPATIDSSKIVPEHLEAIEQMWKRLTADKYNRAYRWDPLGYAKVESQLLRLEEIAVTQPSSFALAKSRVEDAWKSLDMNRPADSFRVSLIEDRQLDIFFHGAHASRNYAQIDAIVEQLIGGLAATSETLPSFWKAPPIAEEPNKLVAPEEQLAAADRPFLVWKLFSEIASREDPATWKKAFTRERILAALNYAGEPEANWLELHLLRLLASEIDWNIRNADRPAACAAGVVSIARVQSLATQPEAEVVWWLRESLEPVEKKFLLGFDELLANHAKEALQQFKDVDSAINRIEPKVIELAAAVASTQEALHAVPHFLAWLTKEYQFAQEQEKPGVELQLKNLGQVVQLTDNVYQYLKLQPKNGIDGIDQGLFAAGADLRRRYDNLLNAFEDYLNKKTNRSAAGAASNSPQTFRRERLCLNSPFLPLDAREKLHRNTREFLEMGIKEIDESYKQETPPQRAAKDAANLFLSSVEAVDAVKSERQRWESLATRDLRLNWEDQFTADEKQQPSVSTPLALRAELLRLEYWQRCFASAFGSFPSLYTDRGEEGNNDSLWPWSCAWQRWNLAAANYRAFQVDRLSEAGWGKGAYSEDSPGEAFYFYQLASRYHLPEKFDSLIPTGSLSGEFQTRIRDSKNASVARLASIRTNFGDQQQIPSDLNGEMVVKVGIPWNAVAQVFLEQTTQQRIPWLRSQPDDCTWTPDLRESMQRRVQRFDSGYWEGNRPFGNLSIRGNVLRTRVAWEPDAEKPAEVKLAMDRPLPNGATIEILSPDEKPSIKVFVLIDCSNSMETVVTTLVEGGGAPREVRLFDQVKETVTRVLEGLRAIHGREANISLGLIPFGLNKDDVSPLIRGYFDWGAANYHLTKEIRTLDKQWQLNLISIIDELQPSSETPLYDAIILACQTAKVGSQEKNLIYVFSDGVNFVGDPAPPNATTEEDLRKAIESNPKVMLNIFHFDYFETWVAGQPIESRRKWREKYVEGLKELESLKTLGPGQYGYYRSDEARQLLRDSMAAIPKSLVSIAASKSTTGKLFNSELQPLDKEIPIEQSFLATELEVKVDGPLGKAKSTVEVLGGEQLKLIFNARSKQLEFESFDASGRKGSPRGAPLKSSLFLRTLTDQLIAANELGFELNFWNGSLTEFTRRPRFIVAELSQSDNLRGGTFVLADHRFMAQTHYPEVRLSQVPWPVSRPAASLRVWASDTIPPQVIMKSIAPAQTETLKLGATAIVYANKGGSVEVSVTYASVPQAKDRVVVICPSFEKSLRTFIGQGKEEKFEFLLPESLHNQLIELQISTIGELEEAVRTGNVTQFDFDRIDLKN
jgi:hypothetical protein